MSRRPRSARIGALVLALALVALGCAGGPPGGDAARGTPELVVSAAQASAPVAGTSQIVLAIDNVGDGDDALVAVDTPAALAVELHLTEVVDGRATMRLLERVALPAGTSVRFRPGELHLMMIVPDERVVVGGTFEVTLRFDRSPARTIEVVVVELLDLVEGAEG
jgi:copper(I)-binding protein